VFGGTGAFIRARLDACTLRCRAERNRSVVALLGSGYSRRAQTPRCRCIQTLSSVRKPLSRLEGNKSRPLGRNTAYPSLCQTHGVTISLLRQTDSTATDLDRPWIVAFITKIWKASWEDENSQGNLFLKLVVRCVQGEVRRIFYVRSPRTIYCVYGQ
jgi:hypothetical protein